MLADDPYWGKIGINADDNWWLLMTNITEVCHYVNMVEFGREVWMLELLQNLNTCTDVCNILFLLCQFFFSPEEMSLLKDI